MANLNFLSSSICVFSLVLAGTISGCNASGDGDGDGDGDGPGGDGDIGLPAGDIQEGVGIDTNGDGSLDGIDIDDDGTADYTGTPTDQNGDGAADGIDVDGDGIADLIYQRPLSIRPTGCNDLEVEFETVIPTVLLLVDRSSSMFDQPLAPYPNRWEPLKEALVGPDGVVTTLQGGIRFGFSAYTHQFGNGAAACPLLDATDISLNNYETIVAQYDAVSSDPIDPSAALVSHPSGVNINPTKGETPTGAALSVAANQLAAYTEPGPKFILLVTDGEPDTCENTDPQCGQDQAIAATQAAFARGIGTFAIGVGEIGVNHLQDLANAGTGQPVLDRPEPADCDQGSFTAGTYSPEGGTAQVFNPSDPDQLKSDITGIVGSVRTCSYTMNAEVDLDNAGQGTVLVNNVPALYDNPNGWRMNSATELEILGSSCEAVKFSRSPDVFISFPCDSLVVVR